MINQTLMIAIGFSCVATILLFLYFKRKITSIEYKLDSLFTLIEQHTKEKNRMETFPSQQNTVSEEQQVNIDDESKIINLITVSDNEIETDSEEEFTTEEESEEEEEKEEEEEEEQGNVKESEFKEIHLENSNKEEELEELEELEGTSVTKLDEYETLEIVDDDKTNIIGVDILNYGSDLEELEELESDFEDIQSINLQGSSKEVVDNEEKEELQKELQYVNLQKLKVPTLRELTDKYNLHENSKKLKKDELIQLLQKHK